MTAPLISARLRQFLAALHKLRTSGALDSEAEMCESRLCHSLMEGRLDVVSYQIAMAALARSSDAAREGRPDERSPRTGRGEPPPDRGSI